MFVHGILKLGHQKRIRRIFLLAVIFLYSFPGKILYNGPQRIYPVTDYDAPISK